MTPASHDTSASTLWSAVSLELQQTLAALAVAEAPSQAYNPLFIHGPTGLGKTHLLQAIAHYVTTSTPDMTACYVTCEAFTNDFIEALREKRIEQFKNRYRTYDVLLVDDIGP